VFGPFDVGHDSSDIWQWLGVTLTIEWPDQRNH